MTRAHALLAKLRMIAQCAGEDPPTIGPAAVRELEAELHRMARPRSVYVQPGDVVPVHVDLGVLHRAADLALAQATEDVES